MIRDKAQLVIQLQQMLESKPLTGEMLPATGKNERVPHHTLGEYVADGKAFCFSRQLVIDLIETLNT